MAAPPIPKANDSTTTDNVISDKQELVFMFGSLVALARSGTVGFSV
jgi:hypothetical protein